MKTKKGILEIVGIRGVDGKRISKLIHKTVWVEKTKHGTNTTGCKLLTNAENGFTEADCVQIANALGLRFNGKWLT